MKVTVEHLPKREVVLNIEAEDGDLEKYRQQAYRHLVQRARIPGFRKGKAPMAMLERYLGKGTILEETLHHLIPEATTKALEEQSIDAATTPDIEVESTDPVAWKARVALSPRVDLKDYQALRIDAEPVTVTDEQVDKVLEELRFQQAPWEPVDRPVELGDLLTADVYAEEDGKQIADDKGVQFRPEADNPGPVPGFAEALVGLKAGETKEFSMPWKLEVEGEDPVEKQYFFRVTVHDVKAKRLAALDDEFAKGVEDGFDTLHELREHLRGRLLAVAERNAKEKLRDEALDRLVESAEVEVADSIVDHEAEHILEDRERYLAQNKVRLEDYLQSMGKTREDMLAELKPEAEKRVLRSLVLSELKDKEGLSVSKVEIDEALDEIVASSSNGDGQRLRRSLDTDAARKSLERNLLTRKTLDRLVAIMTGMPADGAEPSAAEAQEETPANGD